MGKYFEKVLNGGSLEVQDVVESDEAGDENELMSECLTREEMKPWVRSLRK